MLKNVMIMLAVGVLLFEFLEHVIFPLIWFLKERKRTSVCGVTGMLGKVGEIKYWDESEGQIFIHGELWRAVSEFQLSPGDSAVIENVDGLTLRVTPWKEEGGKVSQVSAFQMRPNGDSLRKIASAFLRALLSHGLSKRM
jgi:membrane-bound ClpP family serine protease